MFWLPQAPSDAPREPLLPAHARVAVQNALYAADLSEKDLRFARSGPAGPARVWNPDDWDLAASWHAAGPSGMAAPLQSLFGASPETTPPRPPLEIGGLPENLKTPVTRLVTAMLNADATIKRAFVALTDAERATLLQNLPTLATLADAAPETTRALLKRVDTKAIMASAVELNAAIDSSLPELRTAAADGATDLVTVTVSGVNVRIGGVGADVHNDPNAHLVIDLGGDDRYAGRAGVGVGRSGVLIDLGGDDTYRCGENGLGTGVLGVGIAVDAGGDDHYRAGRGSLGCGLAGTGILRDGGGDDMYDAPALAGGVGVAGLGWLADGGNGGDTYRVADFGLGCGLEGGAGLLTERGGDDHYLSRLRSQAYGAQGGWGSLGDVSGHDDYVGVQNVQAAADRGGAAILIDRGGDDAYLARAGNAQGCALSGGAATLVEISGRDVYAGGRSHPALAEGGGVAVVVDAGGDDRWAGSPALGISGSEGGALAFLVDAGGVDVYDGDLVDGESRRAPQTAALDTGRDDAPSPDTPRAPAELSDLGWFDLAARGEADTVRAAARERLASFDSARWAPILESRLPGIDADEARAVAYAARKAGVIGLIVAQAGSESPARAAGAWQVLALAVAEEARPLLPAGIDRPETRESALRLAGRLQARDLLSRVMPMALDNDPVVARAASLALIDLARPAEASTVRGLANSEDPLVREAAERFFAKFPEEGLTFADASLAADDRPSRRRGVRLLGLIGTGAALKRAGEYLHDPDPGCRIEALRALDGRCPPEWEEAALALRRDEDPRVVTAAVRFRPVE